jgi:hypothetical protein
MNESISVFAGCHQWTPAPRPPQALPMHGALCSVTRNFSGTHLPPSGKLACFWNL